MAKAKKKPSKQKMPARKSATKSARPRKAVAKRTPKAKPNGLARSLQPIYEAFIAWCGVDEAATALAKIDPDATPYLFTVRMQDKLPSLPAKLAPLTADNVVAYYMHPDNQQNLEFHHDVEGTDPSELRGVHVVYTENYCTLGRSVLEKGARLVTMRGDAVIATSGMNGGDIWEIGNTAAVNHGSVEKLIAELRARLG